MQYAEYVLTDRGYYVSALGGSADEIWGLDNMVVDDDDQRFWHLGVEGYPESSTILWERPDKSRCLAVFADGVALPAGGTEIPEADVVALLVSDYGWPMDTRLVDGIPVGPERVE